VVLRSVHVIVVIVVATTVFAHAQPAPPDAGAPDPAQATPEPAPSTGDARPEPGPGGAAAPAAPVASCTGTLDGHVVDASTHAPIAAATVRSGATLLATSDAAGRFSLTRLCPGPLTVIVERDDYKPGARTLTIAGHASLEVSLSSGGEVIEIREQAPPPPEVRATAVISGEKLEKTRGKSFTAALAEVPGVAELRAATGVAKPIIRGQFGRRLLLLVDDIRHRAQEWGLEHAPEIDPFIAEKIRVVRGAGGVRYGSDAIGGVVLVDPPAPRRSPGYNGELHLIGTSNGRGGTVAGRIQTVLDRLPALSLQLEGSAKRLAAPETPTYALDNAGLFEWNAGATIAYRTRRATYLASYRRYNADLGVCSCLRVHNVDDFLSQARAGEPIGADELDADFGIDRPRQAVAHDLALARARWERDELGTITATYSFQHDLRREYDVVRNPDVARAQFNFRLMTHELGATFEHNPIHLSEHWHLRGDAGVTGMAQIHYYSGLHLVPDYRSFSAGAYASERLVGDTTEIEAGVRYDVLQRTAEIQNIDFLRLARSGQLAMDACGADIDPASCRSRFHTTVASLGALHRLGESWTVKGELSRASRAPNPDEQYLNGAAPTFPVLGLGKPDLAPETTYSSSLTLGYSTPTIKAEASAFANLIDNYIYFGPAIGEDGMPIFDVLIRGTFPRFATQAVDAMFWGADGGIELAPIPALELGAQASLVRAKDADDGSYLVFVPADRYRGTVTVRVPDGGGFRRTFATVSGSYVARQRRYDPIADFIAPPPAYFLLGAELGTETRIADQQVRLALQGSNLTNARFRDYTSLMRYFADEPGWQVLLRISMFLDSKKGN
jgi:iron complex outermembrane recepter protein